MLLLINNNKENFQSTLSTAQDGSKFCPLLQGKSAVKASDLCFNSRNGLARPAPKKSSLKAVSCPRPLDLQEESDQDKGEPHLQPASQHGQKKGLKRQQQSSQLQAGDVGTESQ